MTITLKEARAALAAPLDPREGVWFKDGKA